MKHENISTSVIRRLPRYYRYLGYLHSNGVTRVSSKELSEKMGLTASQIRQDLNCFGGFGQQGYGYIVEDLHMHIGNILGIAKNYGAILLGAGNLGRALASNMSFEKRGFKLLGIFDKSEELIGQSINGTEIMSGDGETLRNFCELHKPAMAVLCIPREAVADAVDILIDSGVNSFWNFSHYDISLKYPDTLVENVHLNDSLTTLCYFVNERQGK